MLQSNVGEIDMDSQVPEISFRDTKLPNVGFEVVELATLYGKVAAGEVSFISKPHRIDFHNLIFFTGSAGEHFVDFNSIAVEKGSVVLVNKGQVHAFDTTNQPEGKVVIFTDEYLDRVATAIDVKIFAPTHLVTSYLQHFSLSVAQENALMSLMTLIISEYELCEPNVSYLQVLFAALLTKVSESRPDIYHHHMTPSQIQCFERFTLALSIAYTQTRDANALALQIGTTYKTLNKVCKMATNRTAKQLIDAFTILEAKRRLSIEHMQVQQLSDHLGFDEPTNFIKYFKKHTLMTPNQFKNTA
ncbi:AraC family transcriptional regulator [Shewanella kaireitica]|uniref:AraC family transcriptional regulator n=1 Tax=Shewanella kaireitica TaxID=212021 RepID=UPI00200DEC77|nr:helix-turn-helix domain-containing protein [Shewanella kaireitica]MCL1092733.1 helix-turn-helix domain-containing protein [Shewanella kaireitica]